MNSQGKPEWLRFPTAMRSSLAAAAVVCALAAACSTGNAGTSVEVNTLPEDTADEGAQEITPPQTSQPSAPPSVPSDTSINGENSNLRITSSDPDSQPRPPANPGGTQEVSPVLISQTAAGGGSAHAARKIYLPLSVEWEALRQCESRGDYTLVDSTGTYHGAYQFTTKTWDRLAAAIDSSLLGVLPSAAAATAQDKMAARLWIESGSSRWPACAHVFGEEAAEEYLASLREGDQPPAAAPAPEGGGDSSTTSSSAPNSVTTQPSTPPSSPPSATASTTTPPNPSTLPAVIPNVEGFPTQAQWGALRHCESTNNYQVASSNGLYYGAYQFWPDTWDSVARKYYPRLVGVLPSQATPQDQDRMAYKLWELRGSQPWPICGRHLN